MSKDSGGDSAASSAFSTMASSEYSLRATLESALPAPGGLPGLSSAETRVSDGVHGQCKTCDEACGKQSYCPKHRRAKESIMRQACKGWSEGQPETEEVAAFHTIFGRLARKAKGGNEAVQAMCGDNSLANQVLVEFCETYPDGKEMGKSTRGKVRGKISLTRYVHQHSYQQSVENVSARRKWDFEFFWNQMKHGRAWAFEKSLKEWNKLRDTPGTKRDYLGPVDAPLRLPSQDNASSRASGR
jgi:hypothetical protein